MVNPVGQHIVQLIFGVRSVILAKQRLQRQRRPQNRHQAAGEFPYSSLSPPPPIIEQIFTLTPGLISGSDSAES
jgi:hypothetical protein